MEVSPQRENGHIDIANEIAEALARTNLTAYEHRVLWCIFRKTYGWQKKEDWIALSQIVEMTGMHKAHVSRSKKLLLIRNMVTQRGNQLGFNKLWQQWKELPNGVTNHSKVTQRGNPEEKLPNGVMTPPAPLGKTPPPNGADTKDNVTKDNVLTNSTLPTEVVEPEQPKTYGKESVNIVLSAMKQFLGPLDGSEQSNRRYAWLLIQKAMKQKPCTDVEAANAISNLIEGASRDEFWGTTVRSMEMLYRKANQIAAKLRANSGKRLSVRIS